MGMDLYFEKFITKEEFDRLDKIYWETPIEEPRVSVSQWHECPPSFGEVPQAYELEEDDWDLKAAFAAIGKDVHNYDWVSLGGDIVEFRHITRYADRVEFGYDDIPTVKVTKKYVCTKEVCYRRVGFNKDTFDDLEAILDMWSHPYITKARFEELCKKIPRLREIIFEYYKVPKDLDFDIFCIGW